MLSRFGVMFFADPAKTFANLRRGLKPGGRLVFVCWRAPDLNPWLTLSFAAAKPHLPPQPAQPPDAPGPFAFSDEQRVRGLLEQAGFRDVRAEPRAYRLDIGGGEGLDAAVEKSLAIGPTSRAVADQPPEVVEAVRAAVKAALAKWVTGGEVRLGGAVWILHARA